MRTCAGSLISVNVRLMKKAILLCRQNVICAFVKGIRNQKIDFADKLSVINSGSDIDRSD